MASQVIAALNRMIDERNLLEHPFYRAWSAGELPLGRLQDYAIRYYPQVASFPRYLSAIHSRCSEITTRQALLENLIEEERGSDHHAELWLRFAEALGISRSEVLRAPMVPAIEQLVKRFDQLCASETTVAGLAAIYVYEAQLPLVAAAKIEGLKRFYGVTEERGLGFFTLHRKADVWHSRTDAELIDRHCAGNRAAADSALEAGRSVLEALWSALDAM
jgi:pyrroloquinoline-quinone synthase